MSPDGAAYDYDAFLSYRTEDQVEVESVAEYLRENGLGVFFAPWTIKPGQNWMEAVEKGMEASRHCVVLLNGPAMGDWQQDERRLAHLRQKRDSSFRTIPVLLPGVQDSDLPRDFLGLHSWIDLRQDWTRGLSDLLQTLLAVASGEVVAVTSAKPLKEAICPYRVRPYREEDAPTFFGQESLITLLEGLIRVQSFTALVGPSGSGKTSVVQAGLLPRLRKEKTGEREWVVVTVRPDGDPLPHLCSALASVLSQDLPWQAEKASQWEQEIRSGATGVSRLVRIILGVLHAMRMLLVIDFGEDLWDESSQANDLFLHEVVQALEPLTVLLIFRADYYGKACEHPFLGQKLLDRTVRMTRMPRNDLEQTIWNLEQLGELRLDRRPALVPDLANELEHAAASLSILQYILTELWHRREEDPSAVFAEMGLTRGAVKSFAERALARASVDEGDVRRLLLRLVRLGDEEAPATRWRIPLEEIDPALYSLAETLVRERVLVAGWDDKERKPALEIGHDELAKNWKRLQEWIAGDRAFLIWRQALRWKRLEWEQKSHAAELLLDDIKSLQEARQWRETRANDLVQVERDYIERSEIEHHRRREVRTWRAAKQKAEKELRKVLIAMVVIIASAFAVYIWQAHRNDRRARSVALAAEASRLADRKLDLALILSLQAREVAETAEARGAVLSLTAGNPALRHYLRRPDLLSKDVQTAVFGPNEIIATGGFGKIYLWDAKRGVPLGSPLDEGHASQILGLAFSSDGSLLASSTEAGELIRLWNVRERTELDPIQTDGATKNIAFDPEGRFLAWSTPSGVHLWDLSRGSLARKLPREGNWVSSLVFGATGTLAFATEDGKIDLWNLRARERLLSRSVEGSILGVAFTPDNGSLVTAGSSFQRWSLETGQPIGSSCDLVAGPRDEILAVAISRNVDYLASGHLDRKIRLWDVSDKKSCRLFATLSGHSGLVWTLSFGAERPGNRLALVSGGEGGDTILWEADPQTPMFSVPLGRRSPRGNAVLAVSLDGTSVAVGDSLGGISIFDGETRKGVTSHKSRHLGSIHAVGFHPDGRTLATGGAESYVLLWSLDRQKRALTLRSRLQLDDPRTRGPIHPKGAVRSLAFSRDGAWVAAGTKEGDLVVWKLDGNNTTFWFERKVHKGPLLDMTFVSLQEQEGLIVEGADEPSSQEQEREQQELLVTGGFDGHLTLWYLPTKAQLAVVERAHSQAITSLATRPDGLLATGGQDRKIRFWRVDQDHKLRLRGVLYLGWMISDVALSPEGNLLAAASGEGVRDEVALWDLETEVPLGDNFQTPGKISSLAFTPSGQALYIAGKGVSAWWDLRPETWASRACDMVRRDFEPIEKERYLKSAEEPVSCDPNIAESEYR